MSASADDLQYRQFQQKREQERERIGAAIETGSVGDAFVGYIQLRNFEHGLASVCSEGERETHVQRRNRYQRAAAVLSDLINGEVDGLDPQALFRSAAKVANEVDDRASATDRLAQILIAHQDSYESHTAGPAASPGAADQGELTSGFGSESGSTAGRSAGQNQNGAADSTSDRGHFDPDEVRNDIIEFTDHVEQTLDDVGGYAEVKKDLEHEVIERYEKRDLYAQCGRPVKGGAMLVGPPGCGKTLMAKAVCGTAGWSYGRVSCTAATSALFGKSAKRLSAIFDRAKEHAEDGPTMLFFDEIEALVRDRTKGTGGASGSDQLVSTFLNEMNELNEDDQPVVVVGASNVPDMVDSAVIDNKSRIHTVIEVPLPDGDARAEIFTVTMRDCPTDDSVDVDQLAAETEGFSGGEIETVVDRALTAAINHSPADADSPVPLDQERLLSAIDDVANEEDSVRSHI